MTHVVRVGLVGAGFVAGIHARSFKRIRDIDVQLKAVAAIPQSAAQTFAESFGISDVYEDYRRILDRDDIDVVDLCVPNNLHEAFAIEAAEAGKHIICEKPLTGCFGVPESGATNQRVKRLMFAEAVKSADRIINAAHKAGVKLMYAENWLYCPAVQKAVRLVRASKGTIFEVRAQECHSGSHATYAKAWNYAGGGSLIRLAPHPIAAAIYLKQEEALARNEEPPGVTSVTAEVGDLSRMSSFQREEPKWVVADWQDVENWGIILMTFEDGSRAVISASDIVLGGMEDTFQVFMSNARIDCDLTHSGMMKAYAADSGVFSEEYIMEKVGTKSGWCYPSIDEEWLLGYPQEIRDFTEAVAFDRKPLATAQIGHQVVKVIYAAYLSAEEGRRIDLAGPF
jgi:predicted dehydrogenase